MWLCSLRDIFFLWMDGAYEGSDKQDGHQVGQEIRDNKDEPARMIWRMVRESARNEDDFVRRPN